MAERDRKRGDSAVVKHQAVERGAFGAGLLDAVADDDEGGGQDLQMVAVAADGFHAAFNIGIERLV